MNLSKLNFLNASRITIGFYIILTAFFMSYSSIAFRSLSFLTKLSFTLNSFKMCFLQLSYLSCNIVASYLRVVILIFSSRSCFLIVYSKCSLSSLSTSFSLSLSPSRLFASLRRMADVSQTYAIVSYSSLIYSLYVFLSKLCCSLSKAS